MGRLTLLNPRNKERGAVTYPNDPQCPSDQRGAESEGQLEEGKREKERNRGNQSKWGKKLYVSC